MRVIVIARGAPGSGKSSLLSSEDVGLSPHVLSPDSVRMLLGGVSMRADGSMGIPQEHNRRVWSLVDALARERMARGETLAIDATCTGRDELRGWLDMARAFRYRPVVLDFSRLDLEECLARNAERPEHKRVPDSVVRRMHGDLRASPVPPGVRVVDGTGAGAEKALRAAVEPAELDADPFARVIHVGDVHGCSAALDALLERAGGVRDDDLWVFHGDVLDRGPDNAGTLRRMLELTSRPNVVMLWGNHEDHLRRWADGEEPVSREFRERTLPALEAGGVGPSEAAELVGRLRDALAYRRGGRRVLCTHAGLPARPEFLHSMSLHQLAHGPGDYGTDVDALWAARHAGSCLSQVHGHRNQRALPALFSPLSVNLEDEVERGGPLRAVRLLGDGSWEDLSIPNPRFLSMSERRLDPKRDIIPRWTLSRDGAGSRMDDALWEAMSAHKGVRLRPMPSRPHVLSFNFTKNVFYDQAWDDVVVRARGLFVDAQDRSIVARSYDKFFNLGERPETKPDAMYPALSYPVRAWRKENGFLGIAGWDDRSGTLFTASKSTSEGDFADMFREILGEHLSRLGPGMEERLGRDLRDMEASLAFEVIDPARDPHIAEYDAPKVVLLDVIRRSTDFEKLGDEDRERFAQRYGFEAKRLDATLPNSVALSHWSRRMSQDMSREHEGWVLEDARGFQWKQKTPFYAFWKWMRSATDSIVRSRAAGEEPRTERYLAQAEARGLAFLSDQAREFLSWAEGRDTEELKDAGIIALRRAWAEEREAAPALPSP